VCLSPVKQLPVTNNCQTTVKQVQTNCQQLPRANKLSTKTKQDKISSRQNKNKTKPVLDQMMQQLPGGQEVEEEK
jgi:archaellum component FlaC